LNCCYTAQPHHPIYISCIPFCCFFSHIVTGSSQHAQLLVTAHIVPSLLTLSTLMMEAICSSELLLLTRATQCQILEDNLLNRYWSSGNPHALIELPLMTIP
jgi:hypothetical protein